VTGSASRASITVVRNVDHWNSDGARCIMHRYVR